MKGKTISTFLLERFLLGEVSPAEQKAVESALAQDTALRQQLEDLKSSNARILTELPPALMAHQIREKARTAALQEEEAVPIKTPWFQRLIRPLGIAAPILAVFLFFFIIFPEPTREKGLSPHLVIYQKTQASAQPLAEGQVLQENDILQIAYVAAGFEYGVILSIDGKGAITFHHPPDKRGTTTLEPLKEHLLSRSYQLDNAPYFEKFFLVTSRYPIPVARVQKAAEELAVKGQEAKNMSLSLPPYLEQSSFLVYKKEK